MVKRQQPKRNTRQSKIVDESEKFVSKIVKPSTVIIKPANNAQKRYDAAMRSSEVVFGIGPAGTGKTLLAVYRAAEALRDGLVEKIIVTRPVANVDDEELGFLPGELGEKNQPYFRPVRDKFEKIFGSTYLEYLLKIGKIEATPMAFMRGWSVNAWVIADEMQNATESQFRMLLTRGEEGTKFIINGDPSQDDLEPGKSGLMTVADKLQGVQGVTVVKFTTADIVRSGLTQRIVEALG